MPLDPHFPQWGNSRYLDHLVTLASALFLLILVHALFAEINPAASAALTCALVVTWLVSVARPGTRTTSKRRKQRREEN